MRYVIAILVSVLLSACGHTRIDYMPSVRAGADIKHSASIVEQGFYEDYGKQKPDSAMVTEEFIALSNGSVTNGVSISQAGIYGHALVGLGSTYLTTREINQRIYFRSVGDIWVYKHNGRENRYAVVIRSTEQTTDRRVFFRSEARAKEFADALEYLKQTLGRPGQERATSATIPTGPAESRQQKLDQLTQQNLPYDEYMKRYKAIMAE